MDRDATYVDPSWEQPSPRPGYLEALGRYMESLPAEISTFQEDVAEDPVGTLGGIAGGALQSVPTPPSKYLKKLQEMDVDLSPQAQGGVVLGEDIGKAAQAQAINSAIGGTGIVPEVLRAVGSEIPYMANQSPEASGASILADLAMGGLGYGLGKIGRSEAVQEGLGQLAKDETGAIKLPTDKPDFSKMTDDGLRSYLTAYRMGREVDEEAFNEVYRRVKDPDIYGTPENYMKFFIGDVMFDEEVSWYYNFFKNNNSKAPPALASDNPAERAAAIKFFSGN